jgi:recombination protein RecT
VKLVNEAVYEGELVSKNRFTDEYVFDETKRVSDTVIGYMAYIKLTNGFEKTVYWTIDEVKRHALRYSQTYKKGYGVWVDNFDAMAKKSLVKHLIIKYVPKSIQLTTATEADQASFTGDIDNPKAVYLDNPQNDEVGEAVDFEEVDTESGEVQQEEEPKTIIVVEDDEPTNGELFNEKEQQ